MKQKGIKKPQKHWILFSRSSFTVVTFKIFFPKISFCKLGRRWPIQKLQEKFKSHIEPQLIPKAGVAMASRKLFAFITSSNKELSAALKRNRICWHYIFLNTIIYYMPKIKMNTTHCNFSCLIYKSLEKKPEKDIFKRNLCAISNNQKSKIETIWTFSIGLLHFCFFFVNKVDF